MLILTPNRRLAAYSLQQAQIQALNQGQAVWDTPQIYPLESWLNELWLCCSNYLPVLSSNQQQFLLEKIMQNSSIGVELLRINQTAKLIVDAWGFIQKWRIPLTKIDAYIDYSMDTAAMCQWLATYKLWLEDNGWIDSQSLLPKLSENLDDILDAIPKKIVLRGLQDMPPVYADFFNKLSQAGIEVATDNLLVDPIKLVRTSFIDHKLELTAAAKWAAEHSSDQVAVIVPDLEMQRQLVLNTFLEYIPQEQLNISAPYSLNTYNLINTAFLILRQAQPELHYDDVSALIRSPYINKGRFEDNKLAQLDRVCRDKGIAKLHTGKQQNIELHTAKYWSLLIQQLLNSWGWPGQEQLTREESDLVTCWQELLREYNKLDLIIGAHTYSAAVQYLHRLASTTPFLPAEQGSTRVHVLGMLEAEGIPFDYLWVTGMNRENWPPEAKPNPFLPVELQREYNLPRSGPQRELAVAQRLTTSMRNGARNQVVFSYPVHTDEAATAPSNLIVDIEQQDFPTPEETIKPSLLEYFSDFSAPILENTYVRGGTRILKLQAQCPFRAFAELRLHAEALAEPVAFLTPAQRGSIVHEVLEWYWLENAQKDINQIIYEVLCAWQISLPHIITDYYFKVEESRLQNLLATWLKYENKRDKFTVIQLEKRHYVRIGKLALNIQVDRVDRLEDGSNLVIDYKTGFVQPFDPQLAIYMQCVAPNAAVYYVKSDKVALHEYNPEEVPDLQAIANKFADGDAKVQPVSKQICQSCNLQAMCRIYDS